ncbi:MAG TPA: FAD:protein FMN transferase [Novosphingobium sp.]
MTPASAPLALRFAVPEQLGADMLAGFDPAATVADLAGETMGTRWAVRLALPGGLDRDALARAIQARLDGIEQEMSHWRADSLLCRYNLAQPGSWTSLPPDFAAVIVGALDVAERSQGAFDPAQGRLTDAWGLGPRPAAATPSAEDVAAARAAGGWHRLVFEPAMARLRQPGGLWLDLSGVAKGHAADAVADLLADRGLRHAFVEVGGECVGRGIRPDGDPWWVELETPPAFGPKLECAPIRVALHQLAVATSGDYLRGAHTLDPATGYPPAQGATAVSVLHASCLFADAWASALGVLPSDRAQALAEREGLCVRLLTRDGTEWLSSAFRRML